MFNVKLLALGSWLLIPVSSLLTLDLWFLVEAAIVLASNIGLFAYSIIRSCLPQAGIELLNYQMIRSLNYWCRVLQFLKSDQFCWLVVRLIIWNVPFFCFRMLLFQL